MSFVLRRINPPGKSAMAHEATAAALSIAAITDSIQKGDYLEWADPDANNGTGEERWTTDIDKAKTFETFTAAMECWRAQSSLRPYRPDGMPNRPMTAWSITVEEVP